MAQQYLYDYGNGQTGTDLFQRDAQGQIYRGADGNTVQGQYRGLANGGALSGAYGGYDVNGRAPQPGAAQTAQSVQSKPLQYGNQGGASFGGGSGAAGGGYQPNPYISQQAGAIQAQSNQNLAQNVMPGIRSGALANGQYGGSRQAIAEGVAAGNAQTGVNAAQANLYGNAYQFDQANQTQRDLGFGNLGLGFYNAGNSYNLGLGQLGNQATAQNQNFYTQQRGQDLQQYGLGSSLFGGGVQGQLGVGSGQYGVGQQGYQAPLTAMQEYSNMLNQYTGLGGSSVTSGSSGGGLNGAVGGALAGGQIANNLGLGRGTSSAFSPGGAASSGFGSGMAFGNQDLGLNFG